MKKCFFIALANDFGQINSDASNLILIALKLDFSSLTISLEIQMLY